MFVLLLILCSSLASVFAADPQSPQAAPASTVMDAGEATSLKLFQEALQKNKEGKNEDAVLLFERALKASTTILSQNDEGLIQALKTRREKEFELAPARPETLANLDFVYLVCLGDPNGMLPFLRQAAAATADVTGRTGLDARIAQIEQAIAQEAALQEKKDAERKAMNARLKVVVQTEATATETVDEPTEPTEEITTEEPSNTPPAPVQAGKKRLDAAKEQEMKDEVEYCKNAIPVAETRIRTAEEEVVSLENRHTALAAEVEAAESAFNSSSSDDLKKILEEKRKEYQERGQQVIEKRRELDELRKKLRSYNNRISRAEGILDGTITED